MRLPVPRCYFNPRSPDGERRRRSPVAVCFTHFNPRSPDGERQRHFTVHSGGIEISIHAPRMGSDVANAIMHNQISSNFNPRSPDGERRLGFGTTRTGAIYFNPRSPDGERRSALMVSRALFKISIHAPRMGSDLRQGLRLRLRLYFNPRSPDGERLHAGRHGGQQVEFQSTLPGWGATCTSSADLTSGEQFQSTLPGWGATGIRR